MPRIPSDMDKARAYSEKQKAERETAKREREEREAKTHAALRELAEAAARKMGADPNEVQIFMCRRGRR